MYFVIIIIMLNQPKDLYNSSESRTHTFIFNIRKHVFFYAFTVILKILSK